MNQTQRNKTLWYSLMLAALLMIGCVAGLTGTSLARYRKAREETIQYTVRVPERIYLGEILVSPEDDKESFVQNSQPRWESVDGVTQMAFAVANGSSGKQFAEDDQQVRIRLIGSLGLWDGTKTAAITLNVPQEEDPTQFEQIEAVAIPIQKESPLHMTFGDGWVFTFQDEEGEELSWTLEGGTFSCIEMTIIVENLALGDTSLLQLQVSGEPIE